MYSEVKKGNALGLPGYMFVRHYGLSRNVGDECKLLLQRLEDSLLRGRQANRVDVVSAYACLLSNAKSLSDGKRLHAHILRSGYGGEGFLGDQLVRMYSRCGSVEQARRVFDALPRRNVFSWNIMIAAYAQRGQGDEALHTFHTMALEGASPDGFTVATILTACSRIGAVAEGQAIHELMSSSSSQIGSNLVVQNSLVSMYAKCARVDLARREFDRMATRDTVSWNCMIAAYVQQGDCDEALRLYRGMHSAGVERTGASFATALGACSSVGLVKEVHAEVDAAGFQSDVVVGTALLSTYAKCGSLDDARRTFEQIQHKNVVTWTAMVEAYAQHGQPNRALELYHAMELEGLQPNSVTFVSVVGACSDLEAVELGVQVHARISGSGLGGDVSILNALIDMYGRCSSLEDATGVFEGMRQRNVVSWNAMIMAFARHGRGKDALHVYRKMSSEGAEQNSITFASILVACSAPGASLGGAGKNIHEHVAAHGWQSDVVVGTALVHMYSKCGGGGGGGLDDARRAFEEIRQKNVVAWTAMIAACVQHGRTKEALALYRAMDSEGVMPNNFTFATVLGACSGWEALEEGREIHTCINAAGYRSSDAVLQNALVTMYANCNSLERAWDLFQRTQRKSVVSWSAVIAAYARHGDARVALQLYHQMSLEGAQPNSVTFASALGACAALGALEEGKAIHARFVASGLQSVVVQNAAINLYAKCQRLECARAVFDATAEKDAATWNVMIAAAYAQAGDAAAALDLYEGMVSKGGVQRDEITFATILDVCASAGALEAGRKVHADMLGSTSSSAGRFHLDAALIKMYAKCGSLEEARAVFERIEHKSVLCWTAMIAACVQHGCGREALGLYHSMDSKPNDFTFASILGACSSLAALEEGRGIHAQCIDSSRDGGDEAVHNALLRMYAKCGNLGDARRIFDRMPPSTDLVVWNAMAAAYAEHGHGRQALHIFHELSLQGIQPDSITFVCSLIGCSRAGLVNDARLYFVSMASDFGIAPAAEHYACMIDMLGRAGRLEEAEEVIQGMPFQPDDVARMALLSACKIHGDAGRGAVVAQQLCGSRPRDDAPYVSISNMLRAYG